MTLKPEDASARRKSDYQKNVEANRKRAREYYQSHIEERRAYDRQRQDEKNAAQAPYRKARYQAKKEELSAKAKVYRSSEKGRAASKAHYWKNREKLLSGNKAWREANPEMAAEYDLRAKCRPRGITSDDYRAMFAAQDGKCAICLTEETDLDSRRTRPRSLAIDHDHETGKVRSLLCGACNKGLGSFADNPDLLRRAVLYLEKHRQ